MASVRIDTDDYLERISWSGPIGPDAETLRRLQIAHLQTVPFENLSIHTGEPIVLDDDALFGKIVMRRRGGFCYELNGLFAALLEELGFEVTMLSAGVANANGDFSPPFDHMALLVVAGDRWLVDVGFGETFREPLRLDLEGVQRQANGEYRIERDGELFTMWERKPGQEWMPQYRFGLTAYKYPNFEARCRYHQTSPESHFTQKRICSLATGEGRISLSDMRLIETSFDGSRTERLVESREEYNNILLERFGVDLGSNSEWQVV